MRTNLDHFLSILNGLLLGGFAGYGAYSFSRGTFWPYVTGIGIGTLTALIVYFFYEDPEDWEDEGEWFEATIKPSEDKSQKGDKK